MGFIPLDNSESVYIHDGTDTADIVAISLAEGNSLAKLMRNRERFDYTWAAAADRTAQTGMVAGSRGYQVDTKSEYLYDSSTWRLALPYIEMTCNTGGVPDGTFWGNTTWTVDAANSTDTTMITNPGSDLLRFVRPGIYSVEAMTHLRNASDTANQAVSARSFLDLSAAASVGTPIHRAYMTPGEDLIGFTMPVLRIAAANTDLILYIYKINGVSTLMKSRIRVARLG